MVYAPNLRLSIQWTYANRPTATLSVSNLRGSHYIYHSQFTRGPEEDMIHGADTW